MPTRRRYLRVVGAAAGAGLAGCSTEDLGPAGGLSDGGTDTPAGRAGRDPGWLSRGGSAARIRYNPVTGPSSAPERAWETAVGDAVAGFRGRGDAVVTVDRSTPALTAYDATSGDRRWRRDLDVDGDLLLATGQVVLAGETLAVGSATDTDGEFVALGVDLASGERRWRETPPPGRLFTHRGSLYRLTESEGSPVLRRRETDWSAVGTTTLPDDERFLNGVLAGGHLLYLAGTSERELVAVPLDGGGEAWRTALPRDLPIQSMAGPYLVATDRTAVALFATGDDRFGAAVAAYDLADGSELWRAEEPTDGDPAAVRQVVGAPGYVYLTYQDTGRVEVRDERSGEMVAALGPPDGGAPTFAVAADADAAYHLRTDPDAGTRSLVATDHGGGQRWTRSPQRGTALLAPVGGRLVGIRNGEDGRSVAVLE